MTTVIDMEAKINHEIDWRTSEISTVKTIPFLFSFSQYQQEVLRKHSIPVLLLKFSAFILEKLMI
jgi:hypothetical protein